MKTSRTHLQSKQNANVNGVYESRALVLSFAAFGAAAIYAGLAFYVIYYGHLEEDAYILFTYAENLSRFGEITYFAGGPPAEGATDFLWMLAIAGLNTFGINSGTAAMILNSLGIAAIAALVTNRGLHRQSVSIGIVSLAAGLVVPVLLFAHPGYGGFSTPLYSALVLVNCLLVWQGGRWMFTIPILSLVLALFRPDGAIMAVGFILTGYYYCPRLQRFRYQILMLLSVAMGGVYFFWRWSYFGELLPLPLIVKSASPGSLVGLYMNISWARQNALLIIYALLCILFLSTRRSD